MTMTNTLKTGLRAGVVALALAGFAVGGIAPAQAQSSFGFSLNFGNGGPGPGPGGPGGPGHGGPGFPGAGPHGGPKGGIHLQFGDKDYFKFCMTNSQIEKGIRSKGYRDVQVVREDRRNDTVYVVARKGRAWYSMRVDRCSGKVDRIREIERRRDGSFRIEFNF